MNKRQKVKQLRQRIQTQRGAAIIDGNEFRQDGYSNMMNKYGTKQDNSTAYHYSLEGIVPDIELANLYEGNGLFAKIINRPSEEAVKHGLDIDYGNKDIAEYVEDWLDKLEWEDKFSTAEKWARLYGGSVIVMLVDDGGGLENSLNWKNVRSIDELRVFERAIVQEDTLSLYQYFGNSMKSTVSFGEPEFFHISSKYGSFTVHRSRCLVFRNGRLPEHASDAIYQYWGIPEYIKIKRALRECITSHENGVKLLERCSQAIYKMKNLANKLVTPQGEDEVLQRLQVIDMARSFLNSLVIDNDGEEYTFESMSMSGVKDILDSTCNMLSAVTDIPQTILFGRSPSGMNSTGESDMENYYNMVENIQKQNMKANSRTVIDLILQQGKLEGAIPEIPKYKMKFASLWSMSKKEQADVEKTKADTEYVKAQIYQLYMDGNVIDPSEVRRKVAEEDGYDIKLEESDEILEIPEDILEINRRTSKNLNTDAYEADKVGDYPAAAVLVIKDGKILCASRRNSEGICGPGGHIEDGETPEEAAVREAMEEFNIVPLNLMPLGDYKGFPGLYLPSKLYFTDQLSGVPEADGDEMLGAEWLSLEELRRKRLFPPFEESLNMLGNLLKKSFDSQ